MNLSSKFLIAFLGVSCLGLLFQNCSEMGARVQFDKGLSSTPNVVAPLSGSYSEVQSESEDTNVDESPPLGHAAFPENHHTSSPSNHGSSSCPKGTGIVICYSSAEGISRDEAISSCMTNAAQNSSTPIKCLYDGDVIYHKNPSSVSGVQPTPPANVTMGTYVGYMGSGSSKHMFIKTFNISKADALENCRLNAANNPSFEISCTWNGEFIY